MIDLSTALIRIESVRSILLSKYGVKRIGIFGSVVRGEQNANSDVDVLVEIDHCYTLFEMGGVYSILNDALKEKIDLSEVNHLREELADQIKKEVCYL